MLKRDMFVESSMVSGSRPIRLTYVSAPCRGDSMWGTLADGDCLWVSPISFQSLQVGDVVAFEAGGKVVVHRIVGRAENFFRTQGDGNWSRDSAPLTAANLVGKVTDRDHRGVRSPVAGGARGHRRAIVLRAISRWRLRLRHGRASSYGLLRASRVAALFWRPRIAVVSFASPEGSTVKYIHRGRTVAFWRPQARKWECRMPYDLILFPPSR